jgi:hypothetical protein
MIEGSIALGGLAACYVLGIILVDDMRGGITWGNVAGSAVLAAVALYCLVRFIHWAWITPMPFVGGMIVEGSFVRWMSQIR